MSKPLITTSLIVAALTAFAGYLLFLNSPSPSTKNQILSNQDSFIDQPSPSPVSDLSTLTFLLLGYGGPGHQGGFLTDAIIVAHFNFTAKKLTFISIPRDLWIAFPDGSHRKINAAFTFNPGTAKTLITTITNLPVNYFIAIDFVGFQRLIGQVLAGITVNINQSLTDPWYPIEGKQLEPCGHSPEEIAQLTAKYSGLKLQKQFPCRYEQLHFKKGLVRFEGGDALKYVRSRHSSSDFDRSQRQMEVLLGFRDKLLKLNALDDAAEFLSSLLYTIKTDIDTDIAAFIAPAFAAAADLTITNINLSTTNVLTETKSPAGAFILLSKSGNWQSIHNYISSRL